MPTSGKNKYTEIDLNEFKQLQKKLLLAESKKKMNAKTYKQCFFSVKKTSKL